MFKLTHKSVYTIDYCLSRRLSPRDFLKASSFNDVVKNIKALMLKDADFGDMSDDRGFISLEDINIPNDFIDDWEDLKKEKNVQNYKYDVSYTIRYSRATFINTIDLIPCAYDYCEDLDALHYEITLAADCDLDLGDYSNYDDRVNYFDYDMLPMDFVKEWCKVKGIEFSEQEYKDYYKRLL